MIWHSADINEIADELQVNIQTGLSDPIAHIRHKDMGDNFSATTETSTFIARLINMIKHPIIILMLISCIISMLVEWLQPAGEVNIVSTPIICIIITLATILFNVARDYICEQYISDAQKQIMPSATVIRNGRKKVINSTKVAQGDIIFINEGDCIPADARLISAENLTCNEFVLSGVTSPVVKDVSFVAEDITPISERANMVYSGCWVTHGSGTAIVIETGENTEIGKVARINRKPVLKKVKSNVNSVAKSIGTIIPFVMIALYIIFFLILRFSEINSNITLLTLATRDLFIISALAVASFPISIKGIASLCSAIGMGRLKDKGVSVIDSDCIQTLGRVNQVCIDKTALTIGDLHAVEYYNGNRIIELGDSISPETAMVLRLASACSSKKNDQTDAALIRACNDFAHIDKNEIDNLYPRLSGTPFNHEIMMSVSVNMIDGEPYAIIKGAAESIIPRCDCNADDILSTASQMGAKSLNVIAIAIKQLSSVSSTANAAGEVLMSGFSFLGLIGLSDPLKSDSLIAIKELRDANIGILLMTGDSAETAKSIAHRMGILSENDTVLNGNDLQYMNEYELAEALNNCTVISRATPTIRVRVISILQNTKIVAVSGRNSADSAAIKTADVGCATEKFGTDVAKYSADVVLSNDGVDGMLNMIKGGRNIFQSIRRCVHSTIVSEISIIIAILLGYIVYGYSIFTASQILFAALISNIFPVIALACERYAPLTYAYDSVLYDSCFENGRRIDVAWHSALIGLLTLISYIITVDEIGSPAYFYAQSAAMITFIGSNLFLSYSLRSRRMIIHAGMFSNPISIVSIVVALALTVLMATTALSSVSIPSYVIMISIALSIFVFVFGEIGKFIKSKILRRDSNEQ